MHSTWTHQDFKGKLPSEIFREHFLTCFISDKVGVALRNMMGIDNICWEADYPHSDWMWPGRARRALGRAVRQQRVPSDDDKMAYQNAMGMPSARSVTSRKTPATNDRKAAEGHDLRSGP